jgi:LysR family cys regulon transcriptional activator
VAFKRGAYLRQFVYAFAELLSDACRRPSSKARCTGHGTDYQL